MSVLRYPGGKTRAIKHISPYIPKDTEVLYSPFFGGGSIELTCANKREDILVRANDKFPPLIDFWIEAQNNREQLCKKLYEIHKVMSKENFLRFRNDLKDEVNRTDRAAMFFAINRCSFSGATFSGGYSDESKRLRFTISSIERIKLLDLSRLSFTCQDFTDFFNSHQEDLMQPGHCIYADPPYMLEGNGNKLYGDKGDLHENFLHDVLKDTITKFPRWIISYNDCEKIREMYKDYHIVQLSWQYGMGIPKKSNTSDKKKSDFKEILILSHVLSEGLSC